MVKQQQGVAGYHNTYDWKRKIHFKHWNYSNIMHLKQLKACAARLHAANGSFVPMSELFTLAHEIDSEGKHVRLRSKQAYSDAFAPWLRRNLSPAVQEYLHQKGVAGHHHGQRFFYQLPTSRSAAANTKASYAALIADAESRTVSARLRALPVKDYMDLLPSRALKRVLLSLLSVVSESETFLQTTFGFSVASQARARSKADLAFAMSAKMERLGTARSDVTARGQHRLYLQSVREAQHEALSDEHAGGWIAIAERCAANGIDLKSTVEDCANELGEFDYVHCAEAIQSGTPLEGGSAPVGRDRASRTASTALLRSENCTWDNLAKLVNLKLQKVDASLKVSESTLRIQCVARYSRSREGKRHVSGEDAAQVGSHKISAVDEEWHIDGHQGNTNVSYFETEHALQLEAGNNSPRTMWDDHSKIEAGKKRGYTQRCTLTLKSKRKSAPYSDMGQTVATGGAKAVINSILVICRPSTDPDSSTTSTTKRMDGLLVHKQALAVCRLDNDRRSTPIQQFNDLRFVSSQTHWLGDLYRYQHAFWLSDAGWDHSPRNDEVRWAHTEHHLDCDRDYDGAFVRPKGGSSRNEAERVNGQETIAIARTGSASATHLSAPTSVEELRSNRLAFLTAISNAIAGAYYACVRLIVFRSYEGADPTSDHTSAADRIKLRKVLDAAPSKRAGLPLVERFSNADFYYQKYSISRHLSFQLRRHECLETMGRLCRSSDYPYTEALTFRPCSERPLRMSEVPLVADAQPHPERPGHFLSYAKVRPYAYYALAPCAPTANCSLR